MTLSHIGPFQKNNNNNNKTAALPPGRTRGGSSGEWPSEPTSFPEWVVHLEQEIRGVGYLGK